MTKEATGADLNPQPNWKPKNCLLKPTAVR